MPYHSKTDCYWTIRTVPELSNEKIFLRFTHFDLYTDLTDKGNCNKGHFIQIYEGSIPRDEEKYCERPPPPYTSKGNLVKVYFNTQARDQRIKTKGGFLDILFSAKTESKYGRAAQSTAATILIYGACKHAMCHQKNSERLVSIGSRPEHQRC